MRIESPPDRSRGASSRIDEAAGLREEAFFFGDREARMFGCLHAPLADPVGAVVICCPFQAELLRNYRREVLLARRLAASGLAVQRFHYRGAGHSDGDTAHLTLQTMLEDSIAAGDEVRRRTGVGRIGFIGTRLGGLVAARAASAAGGYLAMWEPVTQAERYVDEILRFRLMHDLKRLPGAELSEAALRAELDREGIVDVLGHAIDRRFAESATGASLGDAVGPSCGPVLLVQVGVGRSLRGEYAALVERWRAEGHATEAEVVRDREAWWISGNLWPVHDTHPATRRLVEVTAGWVRRQAGGPA